MKCERTGKHRYESEEQGTIMAGFLPARSPNHRNVFTLRAYQCQFCGGWHLTHKAKRPEKQNRESKK